MNLKSFSRGILDAIYPPLCSLCGELSNGSSPHCCDNCFDSFELIGLSCCTRCGEPFPVQQEPHLCLTCLVKPFPFQWCRGLYLYRGDLAEAISALKYGKDTSLISPLAEAIGKGVTFQALPVVDIVVPVPISHHVLFTRGFNCVELLARPLAQQLNIPVIKNAVVKKGRKPQVGLGRSARLKNASSSFFPGRGLKKVSGKRVLLVDDVYTTGATALACGRILKKAGAEVAVLTLARAGRGTVIGGR